MDLRHGPSNVVDRLTWQAIHKIDIDLVYVNFSQGIDGPLNNRKRLDSPNRLLYVRREILNAKTCSRHADVSKDSCEFLGDISWIQFERMLAQCRKVEMDVKLRDEISQTLGADN